MKFLNQTRAAASFVLLAMAGQNADAAIQIELELAGLPASYPICQPSWIAGELAYSWEVYFDLDNNAATGSFGSDAKLFVGHWNTCLDYSAAYAATLNQLQKTLYVYNASSGLFVEVEASTPPQVDAQGGNTMSMVLDDSGILRQLTQQSKIVPRAWYRPFGQADGRGDLLTGFVIEQATVIGPGLWGRTDSANDLTGCNGCALYAPFEGAMDIRAVRIQLDAIFVSGLE